MELVLEAGGHDGEVKQKRRITINNYRLVSRKPTQTQTQKICLHLSYSNEISEQTNHIGVNATQLLKSELLLWEEHLHCLHLVHRFHLHCLHHHSEIKYKYYKPIRETC